MYPPRTIGVRKFLEDLKKIERSVSRGSSFIVTRHQKPIFEVYPPQNTDRKTLLEEFKHIQFSHPDPNLSKKIDEIVYGL